jgi:hypothetical protein
LPAVTDLGSQNARGNGADTWNGHQALTEIVVGQLIGHLPVKLCDLLAEVLEVGVQALEDCDQAWRQRMLGEQRRQACNDSFAYRQADAKFQEKAMHLVASLYTIVDK